MKHTYKAKCGRKRKVFFLDALSLLLLKYLLKTRC